MFEPTEITPEQTDAEARKASRMSQPRNVARSLRVTAKVALALAQRMEATDRISDTTAPDSRDMLLKDLHRRTEYLVELALWALRTQEARGENFGTVYTHPQTHSKFWYER